MEKCFIYNKEESIKWEVKYDGNNRYRNYVLLKQLSPNIQIRNRTPLIMFNPGAFTDEDSFREDKTFQVLTNIFLNIGHEIEILNLYNLATKNRKALRKMDENERDDGNNPIFDRLKDYPKGSPVIIQWGKLEKYANLKPN